MFDLSFGHSQPPQPQPQSRPNQLQPNEQPSSHNTQGRDPNHANNPPYNSSNYNSAFVNLSTLTDMTTLDWWSQPHTTNPATSSVRDRDGNLPPGSTPGPGSQHTDDDDKASISSAERRRAIQAEASPSSTTAISVQPFDAVFPADGEHQVYAEEETFDVYRMMSCAMSMRVMGFFVIIVGIGELAVGIWVDR